MEKLLVLLSLVGACLSASGIDYSNQAGWEGSCNTGSMQSPIDVNFAHNTVHYTSSFPDVGADVGVSFDGSKYVIDGEIDPIKMPSNWPVGHTNGLKPLQLHIHWGKDSTHGAEHHLFGDEHAGEVHLVMRNLDQNDENADDYYSVFGIFLDEVEANSAELDASIVELMGKIAASPNDVDALATFPLSDFYDTENEVVYTYEGSLTTPTCTEHVFWHVFDRAILVPSDSMTTLRASNDESSTNRDTQALNGREITQRLLGQKFDDSEFEEQTNDSSQNEAKQEETDQEETDDQDENVPDFDADGCEYDTEMNMYKCYYGSATSVIFSSILGATTFLVLLL